MNRTRGWNLIQLKIDTIAQRLHGCLVRFKTATRFRKTSGTQVETCKRLTPQRAIDSSGYRFAIYLHRTICFELQTGIP